MAEIDAPELDQQVAQSRALVSQAEQQLSQARSALVQAEAQRDLAKVTSTRYNNLVTRGAIARQDADTQESTYKTAEALVEAQQASVRASGDNVLQAQANLQRVIDLQEYKNVRAPFNGVVTARNIDTGALISAGGAGQGVSPMSVGGAQAANGNEMFRMAQIDTIRILTSVPQANAPDIFPGMPADVTVLEFQNRKFAGKVTRTTNSLDPNSRTLLVEVQVPNRDGKLLPGMYAQVHFRSHRDAPPLLVPGDTLIAGASGLQVAVLLDAPQEGKGTKQVHVQSVQIGRDYGTETEIQSGLAGSELLVVNPGDDVKEGAFVRAESGGGQKGAGKKLRAVVRALHPGEHLAEDLRALGMSAAELERKLDVSASRVRSILNGQRAITGDMALRLSRFFGTSAEFWLNLQKLYERRKQYRTPLMASIHETAEGLHAAGSKRTMRKFDSLCLTPERRGKKA